MYFMSMLRTDFTTYNPNVYEVVSVGFKNKGKISDRSAKNIYTQGWYSTLGHYGHPAEKPENFCRWLIQKGSPECGSVVDLFGGSGTTLAACESEGRKCFMMEIEPERAA